MRNNLTKEKIKNGGTAFGCFCNLYSRTIVETLGLVGFDFVIMDAEHGPMGVSECEAMVRAADYTNITPIIRIAENVRQNILRYLDIHNEDPKPFIWTKTADQILANLARFCQRTLDSAH